LLGGPDDHIFKFLDTVCASHPSLLAKRRSMRRHAINLMVGLPHARLKRTPRIRSNHLSPYYRGFRRQAASRCGDL